MLLDESDETRAAILDELQASRQWPLNELSAVTVDRGASIVDVDPRALQRVLVPRVPEVCALMSQTLHVRRAGSRPGAPVLQEPS